MLCWRPVICFPLLLSFPRVQVLLRTAAIAKASLMISRRPRRAAPAYPRWCANRVLNCRAPAAALVLDDSRTM